MEDVLKCVTCLIGKKWEKWSRFVRGGREHFEVWEEGSAMCLLMQLLWNLPLFKPLHNPDSKNRRKTGQQKKESSEQWSTVGKSKAQDLREQAQNYSITTYRLWDCEQVT